ncbi:MAG: peptide chain release factor 2 [Planctomycetota bacterium]
MQHDNIPGILEAFTARIEAMKDSMRLDEKAARQAELEAMMNAADFWDHQDQANAVIDELKTVKALIDPVRQAAGSVEDAVLLWEMAAEADDQESKAEVDGQLGAIGGELDRLETSSLLSGKYDPRNCYLTIQSGAGGTEADDWAEMLMRMYLYHCEKTGWDVSEVSKTHGTEAGIKEVTLFIKGPMAYGYLSAEAGTHRLARVSPFNAEGKRQTSFAAVEVVPEFPDTGKVELDEEKLETTQFARSSGPGGQNVNKVASAIRLVYRYDAQHTLTVVCSVERKAEQNRKLAMSLLKGKIELLEEQKRQAEMDAATGGGVDRGWGSQIRSYVFYDNRVKDHRTNFEVGNPQAVLDGNLQGFIDAELKRRAKAKAGSEG